MYDEVIKACLSQKRDRPIISVVLRGLQLLMETHEVNRPEISGNSNIPQPMNQGYDRFLVPDQPSSNGSGIMYSPMVIPSNQSNQNNRLDHLELTQVSTTCENDLTHVPITARSDPHNIYESET